MVLRYTRIFKASNQQRQSWTVQPRASCRSVLSALGGRLKTKFSKSSLHRELINHKKTTWASKCTTFIHFKHWVWGWGWGICLKMYSLLRVFNTKIQKLESQFICWLAVSLFKMICSMSSTHSKMIWNQKETKDRRLRCNLMTFEPRIISNTVVFNAWWNYTSIFLTS